MCGDYFEKPARTDLPSLPDSRSSERGSSDSKRSFYERNGPFVINTDGTLSRIKNWDEMAPIERDRAKRIIAMRNKQRMEAIKDDIEEPLHAHNTYDGKPEMPICGPEK